MFGEHAWVQLPSDVAPFETAAVRRRARYDVGVLALECERTVGGGYFHDVILLAPARSCI